jgi:hypothetical protein
LVALLGAAVVGGVLVIVIRGGAPAAVAPHPPPVSTATVERTDLATTVLTEGTLGDAVSRPVVNRMAGTYTDVPVAGTAIGFGQTLYRVDDAPVVLMQGATPAWRAFSWGMVGPDVTELQLDLIALGDAAGLFSTASGRFDALTFDAIERWQEARGRALTGEISFGEIVFLPDPILVGATNTAPGFPAAPGDVPFTVTTTTRVVSVPLTANIPNLTVGESVSIVLPSNATTPGRVTGIGPAPVSTGSQPGNAGGNAPSSPSNGGQAATTSAVATIVPEHPSATGAGTNVPVQVALTTQSAHGVLAIPIAALLGLAGGGYGVEVVDPSGVPHLEGVTTGVFTGSQVEIAGSGIEVGTRVVVAQ